MAKAQKGTREPPARRVVILVANPTDLASLETMEVEVRALPAGARLTWLQSSATQGGTLAEHVLTCVAEWEEP